MHDKNKINPNKTKHSHNLTIKKPSLFYSNIRITFFNLKKDFFKIVILLNF